MGYVKEGEVFVKMPVPIKLRDDLKTLALLDKMTLKEKIWRLYQDEVDSRADELKELEERRQKRNEAAVSKSKQPKSVNEPE